MNPVTTTASSSTAAPGATATHPASSGYNLAVGYLRAFLTLLVVAHHAALAYHPYAPPPPATLLAQPRIWQAFPVVDPQKWGGFSFFVGFNDIFFMALMFFLSGLFVYPSLERKGVTLFLCDRLLRLGLPFAVAAAVIAPLAYYPAYLQTSAPAGFAGFWQQWRALGNWPAGPAWFLWLLLAFDVVAAVLFATAPALVAAWAKVTATISRRPIALFALISGLSAVAYLPLAFRFSPVRWSSLGPFAFQTSRPLHYFVYFFVALGVGAFGAMRGLFSSDGKLARRWPRWVSAMFFCYCLVVITFLMLSGKSPEMQWPVLLGILWVLSCAASGFGFMSLFARFATRRVAAFDSLTDNAYGMYLVHYAVVSWLQLAMLKVAMPGLAKGVLATLGTIALSWAATAALRRVPAVARVI